MLYTAGIRPLVRKNYYLHTDTLSSYHTFMFSHLPASFNALQGLVLDNSPRKNESTALLVDILSRGNTQIQQLCLVCGPLPDDMAEAVASLTHLHKLEVHIRSDEQTAFILSHSQSPLVEISTSFSSKQEYPVLPLLARFSHTLTTLTLDVTTLHDADVCFPRLTLLDLQTRHSVPLSVLMRIFPNLQELHLECYANDVEKQQSLRCQNIAFQQGGHTWTSLRRLEADIMSLSVLALLQDLDGLTIARCSGVQRLDSQNLPMLQSILSKTHPRSLNLSLDPESDTLQAILLSAGLERIADLSLDIALESVEDMADMLVRLSELIPNFTSQCSLSLQHALLPALAQLSSRIQHLNLLLVHPLFTFVPRSKRPVHKLHNHGPIKCSKHTTQVHIFEGFEMGTFARCVKDALPQLEKLSLRIEEQGDSRSGIAERWVSLAVEYDAGRAARFAVQASDEALRDVIMGTPTGTVYFSSFPRATLRAYASLSRGNSGEVDENYFI